MFFKFALATLSLPFFVAAQVLQSPLQYVKTESDSPMVFLAGSSYYNWREGFMKKMGEKNYIFVTPTADYGEAKKYPLKRIRWEQKYIDEADSYVVWIPRGDRSNPRTLSLTTLFELGRFVEYTNKPLIIGIEQGYVMRDELINQLRQLRNDVIITDSLDALAKEAQRVIKK